MRGPLTSLGNKFLTSRNVWHLWDPQYSLDFVWLDAAQEVACAFSRRQRAGGLFSSARGRSFLRFLTNSEASSSLETSGSKLEANTE